MSTQNNKDDVMTSTLTVKILTLHLKKLNKKNKKFSQFKKINKI